MMRLLGLWHMWGFIALLMIGLYIVMTRDNLVKKMMGLNIFQVAVIFFYVSAGRVDGGTAPIWPELAPAAEHGEHGTAEHGAAEHGAEPGMYQGTGEPAVYVRSTGEPITFSNPLPHVLMLTAIVVGVATTAMGLALVIRIKEEYGTAEEDEIVAIEAREDAA
jgi:multicomponent Na+:H+ antiporter subunit C